jgi:hypothetical protein
MGKQKIKPYYRRRVLRLPDLDHCKLAVLNSLGSPASRRVYEYAINQFIAWYCSEPRLALNRIVVVRYRMHLESRSRLAHRYEIISFESASIAVHVHTSPAPGETGGGHHQHERRLGLAGMVSKLPQESLR